MIANLQQFWSDYGCVVVQPWNSEVGAGTFNPNTFLRSLGPEPWRVAYVEPSKRPKDGRYLENQAQIPVDAGIAQVERLLAQILDGPSIPIRNFWPALLLGDSRSAYPGQSYTEHTWTTATESRAISN